MGPSGSGKTTLLDLISARRKVGSLSGTLLVDGREPSEASIPYTAYVPQFDLHIPSFTVRETLVFAARLRMKGGEMEVDQKVNEIIEILGLESCQFTIVGSEIVSGISGGQLRRLSLGVEIITSPPLILLDEPTTGLDSSSSLELMTFIKTLSSSSTIICTIHQPTPIIFELFSQILMLSEGHVVFQGAPNDAVDHFTSSSLNFQFNGEYNPAEFLLDVASGSCLPSNSTSPLSPDYLETQFWSSSSGVEVSSKINQTLSSSYHPNKQHQRGAPPPSPSTFSHISTLCKREWSATFLNGEYFFSKLSKTISTGLLIGVIFFQRGLYATDSSNLMNEEGTDLTTNAYNTCSALFFTVMLLVLGNIETIPELFATKLLYTKEMDGKVFTPFSLWVALAFGKIPMFLLHHLFFSNIIYFMVGFNSSNASYWMYQLILFLTSLLSLSFAHLLSAYCSSPQSALGLYPPTFMFLSMFAGFSILIDDIPSHWKWASDVSYVRWVFEGLCKNEVDNYNQSHTLIKFYDYDVDVPISFCIMWIVVYMIVFNGLFYYFLIPSKSNLKYESAKNDTISDLEEDKINDEELNQPLISPSNNGSHPIPIGSVSNSRSRSSSIAFTPRMSSIVSSSSSSLGPRNIMGDVQNMTNGNHQQVYVDMNKKVWTQSIDSTSPTNPINMLRDSIPSLIRDREGSQKTDREESEESDYELVDRPSLNANPTCQTSFLNRSIERYSETTTTGNNMLTESDNSSINYFSNNSSAGLSPLSSFADALYFKDIELIIEEEVKELSYRRIRRKLGFKGRSGRPPSGLTSFATHHHTHGGSKLSEDMRYDAQRELSKVTEGDEDDLEDDSSILIDDFDIQETRSPSISSLTDFDIGQPPNLVQTSSLLKRVSGVAFSGEITIVLGGSGSGKSSLLRCISGRQRAGNVRGQVFLDGRSINLGSSCSAISFVHQMDVLFPFLTVRETLMFASKLRDIELEDEKHEKRVYEIIKQMGLEERVDVIVGGVGAGGEGGLSGGQRKRLSIGCELISSPACLVLDEPTSGLDSALSLEIMMAMRGLADKSKIIIAALHSPSPQMMEMAERVLLLSHGRVIYHGLRSEAMNFFTTDVGLSPPPSTVSIEEFMVEVCNGLMEDKEGRLVSESEISLNFESSDIYRFSMLLYVYLIN